MAALRVYACALKLGASAETLCISASYRLYMSCELAQLLVAIFGASPDATYHS